MICACYRHTNKVVVIHSYQLYGVRLEGFHSWQRVFFLYLYPFVPDGAEKDCIEIPYLLCGDCGHTAALRLPSPGHRNYFVDLHIVYSGDDTRGTLYNSGRRTRSIDRITPHCVVGQLSAEETGNCFLQAVEASCNYGIGKDGRVCLVVDEACGDGCTFVPTKTR